MSNQWWYQVMGTEVGPITPAELKQRVKQGQIQPDTLVRHGPDGKWLMAERFKGLLDAPTPATPIPTMAARPAAVNPPATAKPAPVKPAAAPAPEPAHATTAAATVVEMKTTVASVPTVPAIAKPPVADDEDDDPHEYDFFRFVGFRAAIGTALHDLLNEHCRVHHLTFTQATRRALAEFLGRKDLGEEAKPPEPKAAEPPAAVSAASFSP